MWHSSSNPRAAGFTLMEVLVVLACLGMILWMTGQLLFPMRAAAERQRLQVEARQTARGAADYVAYTIRGATDLNEVAQPRNPAAILTYLWKGINDGDVNPGTRFPACPTGDPANCVQLSFNNVTDAALATPGTDIISLTAAQVAEPITARAAGAWPGPITSGSTQYWAFNFSCSTSDDASNFAQFRKYTQIADPADPTDPSKGTPLPLILKDPSLGTWLIYQIAGYGSNSATCTSSNPLCVIEGTVVPCIDVSTTLGAEALNPPGGLKVITNPPDLVLGSRFMTLRVCNGWLEQKEGFLDPTGGDLNCPVMTTPEFPDYVTKAGWSPLLANVEDFQIAYIFRNDDIGNGPGGTLTGDDCTQGVPSFDLAPSTPTRWDARNVIGIRVTITARSSTPVRLGGKMELRQPAAEDHDPTTAPNDTYYRYQVSALAMLRNRLSGI